jgi:hypothetical protein
MGGGLGRFPQGVEGTGADVAVDDTKGAERGGCGELSGMAPAAVTGVLVTGAPIGIAPAGSAEAHNQLQCATRRHKLPWGSDCRESLSFDVDDNAGINEVLGGHPEDLKPEQSGSK